MKNKLLHTLAAIGFISMAAPATAQESKGAWADDVSVNPVAGEVYSHVRVAAGSDGALYLGRLEKPAGGNTVTRVRVLRSADTGRTWSSIIFESIAGTIKASAFDMIVVGTGSNYRIILGRTYVDTASSVADFFVNSFDNMGGNNVPFAHETYNNPGGYLGIALSSDWRAPSNNASPYCVSVGIIKRGAYDSVILFATKDMITINRKSFYGTIKYIKNISVATGSLSSTIGNRGRIGVAWTEYSNNTDAYGTGMFNYAFSDDATPLSASALPVAYAGSANPNSNISIALSQSTTNKNIRVMIASEQSGISTPKVQLYVDSLLPNSYTPAFNNFIILANNTAQPHLMWDPVFSNYLITYYNTSTGALPYQVLNYSSMYGGTPGNVNTNYRTAATTGQADVFPRVDINTTAAQAVFGWCDAGKSMFDAEYQIASTSVSGISIALEDAHLYPNPAHSQMMLRVSAREAANGKLSIIDMSGRQLYSQPLTFTKGTNEVPVSFGNLPAGNYLLQLSGERVAATYRFVVN